MTATTFGRLGRFFASPLGLTFLVAALYMSTMALTGVAHAQTGSTNPFGALFYKVQDFFYNVRYLALIVGAIAVVAIMVGAMSGRFPVQKAIVFAAAIALIGSSGMIVTYFSSGNIAQNTPLTTTSTGIGVGQLSTGAMTDTEGTPATP